MKNLKVVLVALTLMFAVSLTAQKKISQLPELVIPQSTDVIPIVNNGTTKQIEVQNLLKLSIVNDSLTISGGNTVALPAGGESSGCQYTSFNVETIDGDYIYNGCFSITESYITGYISELYIYDNGVIQDTFVVNSFLPLFNYLNGEPNVYFSDDDIYLKANENINIQAASINVYVDDVINVNSSEFNIYSTLIYINGALSFKDQASTEWINAGAGRLMVTDGSGTGDVFGTSGILFIKQ